MIDNAPIRIYLNKVENIITFKTKTWYFLELLTSKTMKLLRRNKNKITQDEDGDNLPHVEITEVVLVHCKVVKNDYQHNSRVLCIHLFLINFLVND